MNKSSILTVGIIASAWLFAANGPQAPLPAPAQEKAGVTKYEYKIVFLGAITSGGKNHEATLNDLGAEGWDLGSMAMVGNSTSKVIMKRVKR